MQWFDYAVVRYMPNPMRGEVVNIGLIVFKDTIDIRLLKSASKLRMLDNSSSQKMMLEVKHSLVSLSDYAATAEEFNNLLASFPGGITLSETASFSVDHFSQYESKVEKLFEALIKPYSVRESSNRTNTRLITTLKRKFSSIELLAKDESGLSEHKIVSNYMLNEATGLTADFLLKNGKFHLTEVIDYDVLDTKSKLKETTMKLMTFAEGQKSLEGEVCSYFVYSASAKKEQEVIQQINLAENYSTNIFNIASKDDEASYFQIIENAVGRSLPLVH
ncbi:DUF3037 domain-containing protein [Vibrio harveyi]|uniref:DUF3037 domain-containing protein n=1 Tax=Vibrio parahaemolyticus TaxID=670 RepID=UPI0029D51073|nr:DUF3037 domain-containing protein [Vibrio parahaemolyticus]ELY1990396.1 DUF3037 domain-containing protein [Vibrio harveyi]MEA5231154.1 DUF3037 domain-containing protein [Vibrio parahaemolyticus]